MISRRFGGLVGDYIQGWLLHSRETNPLIGALGSAVTIAGAGRVAELADAQDSGSCPGNRVEVQVLSRPRLRSLAVTYDATGDRAGAVRILRRFRLTDRGLLRVQIIGSPRLSSRRGEFHQHGRASRYAELPTKAACRLCSVSMVRAPDGSPSVAAAGRVCV